MPRLALVTLAVLTILFLGSGCANNGSSSNEANEATEVVDGNQNAEDVNDSDVADDTDDADSGADGDTESASVDDAEGEAASGASDTGDEADDAGSDDADDQAAGEPDDAAEAAPTPPSILFPTRIEFEPGAESATVEGTLRSGGDRRAYVLEALEGQTMQVIVTTVPPDGIAVDVRDANGIPIVPEPSPLGLAYPLPVSGNYMITLSSASGAPATAYTMTVAIGALAPAPEPEPGAERIEFEPGAESAAVAGTLPDEAAIAKYVLKALEGQTMRLFVTTVPETSVEVTVTDEDGGAVVGVDSGAGGDYVLPGTGDYLIALGIRDDALAVDYTLTVYIAAPEPAASAEPERIEFEPGADAATVSGVMPSDGAKQTYLLRALEAQTMRIAVDADPVGAVNLTVLDPNGEFVLGYPVKATTAFDLALTGDYTIELATAPGTPETTYSMEVAVR